MVGTLCPSPCEIPKDFDQFPYYLQYRPVSLALESDVSNDSSICLPITTHQQLYLCEEFFSHVQKLLTLYQAISNIIADMLKERIYPHAAQAPLAECPWYMQSQQPCYLRYPKKQISTAHLVPLKEKYHQIKSQGGEMTAWWVPYFDPQFDIAIHLPDQRNVLACFHVKWVLW